MCERLPCAQGGRAWKNQPVENTIADSGEVDTKMAERRESFADSGMLWVSATMLGGEPTRGPAHDWPRIDSSPVPNHIPIRRRSTRPGVNRLSSSAFDAFDVTMVLRLLSARLPSTSSSPASQPGFNFKG